MKQYNKPTFCVVELSVKENIAALPTALTGAVSTEEIGGKSVTVTTYNLAAQSTSTNA